MWIIPLLLLYPAYLYSEPNTGTANLPVVQDKPVFDNEKITEKAPEPEAAPVIIVKSTPKTKTEIEQSIIKWAVFYGVDQDKLLRIAKCESTTGQDPNAYNGKSGHYGLFQYKLTTWASKSAAAGVAGADVLDNDMNAKVTAWAFANNQGDAWECQ